MFSRKNIGLRNFFFQQKEMNIYHIDHYFWTPEFLKICLTPPKLSQVDTYIAAKLMGVKFYFEPAFWGHQIVSSKSLGYVLEKRTFSRRIF